MGTFNLITGKKPEPTQQQGSQWQQVAAQQPQFAPPVAQQQPAQHNTPYKDPMVMQAVGQPPALQQAQLQVSQPQAQSRQAQPASGKAHVQHTEYTRTQTTQPVQAVKSDGEQPYVSPTAHMSLREKVKYFTGEDLNAPDKEDNPYRSNQIKTYEDMTRRLEDEERRLRPETEEQKAKREKRERREKLFAAIGDGLSALSNVYFTTQGAPDMSSKRTLTNAVQGKYDKMKADREADRDKYLNILKMKADNFGKLGDMDDAKRARRAALIKSAYDYEAKQDDNARKNRESNSKIKLEGAKGDKYKADAAYSTAKAKEEPKNAASKRALDAAKAKEAHAGAAKNLAQAHKARAEAAAARKAREAKENKYTLNLGKKGTLKFPNETEYKKAVYRWANEIGVDAANIEGEERGYDGKVRKKGNVRYKPTDVVAGYVESVASDFDWDAHDRGKSKYPYAGKHAREVMEEYDKSVERERKKGNSKYGSFKI